MTLRRHLPVLFTAIAWLGGWAFLSWGLADLFGPVVWKFSTAVLLCGAGGLRPLLVTMRGGLAVHPPWHWARGKEKED